MISTTPSLSSTSFSANDGSLSLADISSGIHYACNITTYIIDNMFAAVHTTRGTVLGEYLTFMPSSASIGMNMKPYVHACPILRIHMYKLIHNFTDVLYFLLATAITTSSSRFSASVGSPAEGISVIFFVT